MPGHARTHHSDGDGDDPEPTHVRTHGAGSDAHSVRAAEEAIATVAADGRAGARLITQSTGTPGGRPDGHPTRIGPKEDESVQRSIDRENSTAVTLADRGFRVRQNPTAAEVAQARADTGDVGRPTSKPDYLIEGRVFDCYAPDAGKNVRGVWFETGQKVKKMQTQRVVVNLEDWRGNLAALQRQFDDWPIEGLKEVKIVTRDGDILQVFPKNANDGA
jgi:Contact-dependent growth inhibition CdiA C-terminal domain